MSNSTNEFLEKLHRNRGSRIGTQVIRAKSANKAQIQRMFVKNLPKPCVAASPPTVPAAPDFPHHGIGEGRFTDNFVLVKIPAGFLGGSSESVWVPAPRQELYQLEMTRSAVNRELQMVFLEVAELELKALFEKPEVSGSLRIPRVGRNALTFAVFGEGLYGFEVEKDPDTISTIMKESLLRVVTRKREVREPSICAASDITETTEKGSVDIFPIACDTKSFAKTSEKEKPIVLSDWRKSW